MSEQAPEWFQEFIKNEWLDVKSYMAVGNVKQEQTERELAELTAESEKNKKFRHITTAVGSSTTFATAYAAIKVFFGWG
jgi:hypothetical protein